MVCNRCIKVVADELLRLGFDVRSVTLGEAVVSGHVSEPQMGQVAVVLGNNGFELIKDRRAKTVERIKHAILKFVRNDHEKQPIAASPLQFIASEVGQDHHTLSKLFSSIEGMTVEHYLILQKIERVKELIKYGELNLSAISYLLGYSSLQHLSNQFKQITGMTPSEFKKLIGNTRKPLDTVSTRKKS